MAAKNETNCCSSIAQFKYEGVGEIAWHPVCFECFEADAEIQELSHDDWETDSDSRCHICGATTYL